MSEFTCPVIKIDDIAKHFNADSLSITEVEGCPCIFRTEDFKRGDQAIYIPVEAMIPQDREWVKKYCSHLTFKNGWHRVKAVRLRKVFSMGILVPFQAGAEEITGFVMNSGKVAFLGEGADAAEILGIKKFEETDDETTTQVQRKRPWYLRAYLTVLRVLFGYTPRKHRKVPEKYVPTYDVEHWRKHKNSFFEGEDVVVSEKIHGSNASFVYKDGKLHVSSHKRYRPEEDNSVYWRVARELNLEEKLKDHEGMVFYGEVYGPSVQDMTYDVPQGQVRCRFYDVRKFGDMSFLNFQDAFDLVARLDLQWVPLVYHGPYDQAKVEAFADGPSLIASHFREGVVVRTAMEKYRHCGRMSLKVIGQTYLLRKEGTEKH